ncbi:methylation-associated defense system protein kinase MAD6 [Emticicia sp. TH156]|uniref:methylation-associated defense system protein kinase MAD6 n=1 Tax=Emticicia sp. TH156 TaxID=2067454 RepID=UPI000C757837|nr:serine/threonine protein kinase [Emticicia sp. TH156]PLK44981.1 serine/threonine protein kinase [Emticicia sp. TH156]
MASVIKPPYFESVVNEGEQRLLNYLEVHLPNDYYLIPNIELASTNPHNQKTQYWEYDLVVVAPHAIYHIENKDWRGRIEGDDNYWYINDKEKPNPLKVGRQKTAILASKLKEHNRHWGRAWVQNLVTLSYPNSSQPILSHEASKVTFRLDSRLKQYLTDPTYVGKQTDEIVALQEEIKDYLIGKQSRKTPDQKREVVGYEIMEVRSQDKYCTEYLVKSSFVGSPIKRIVKEYYLQVAGMSLPEREKWELRISNGRSALEKLRGNPFVVKVEYQIDNENHLFYEISDFMEEQSLAALAQNKTFTLAERLNIIQNLCSALRAAHQEKVFHRDINPHNIYMSGGYAYLGNFGKAYFLDHEEQGYTVHPSITEENATAYHPLEMVRKDASEASDIYSLAVLIYWLFVGETPIVSPFELNKLGGTLPADRFPTAKNAALPKWLDELCEKTIIVDFTKRLQSIEALEALINKEKKEEPQQKPPALTSTKIKEGDREGDYTFYNLLGRGGYSEVYKVKHSLQGKDYAMKVFNESVNARTVIDEYEALKGLNHPNIVKFIWNGTRDNGQFYTLMEYLEGENISNYVRTEASLPLYRIYELAEEILTALVYMQAQENPVLHRDIKPQNIIWIENQRFVLIDFNVASLTEEKNNEIVGTIRYIAPDLLDTRKVDWDLSADTFSLGITLYELVCKQYPWLPHKMPISTASPNDPQSINSKISKAFSEFLLKSIGFYKENRFANAQLMLSALQQIGKDGILAEQQIVPLAIDSSTLELSTLSVVDYVNSLYSQSRFGNAGTRASASTVQTDNRLYDKLTYTPTKLDKKLIPAITDGKFKLVIITGNAGDGKTAFIQKIEEDDKISNLQRFTHRNGSSFILNGVRYETNYDGSQDQENSINDDVLNEFFSPFRENANYQSANEGRIVAINEGRLVEFLQTSKDFKHLDKLIDEYFYNEGHTILPTGIMIINLNLRSVVASSETEPSLFREQIRSLTQKTLWNKCDACALANKCFIKYNVDSFNDSAAGEVVISRMEFLLKTVSLKRELHITMRDLRSLIAFMLTRNFNCDSIEELLQKYADELPKIWEYYYFNISNPSSADGGEKDRLIKLLRETDIGEVSIPNLDRELFFAPHKAQHFLEFAERSQNLIEEFNTVKNWRPTYEQQEAVELHRIKSIQKSFIRHQYFEGKLEKLIIDGQEVPAYMQRIPYHSAFQFVNIFQHGLQTEQIKQNISKAISINEGCDNDTIDSSYLVLASSEIKDTQGNSYRLFSLNDFELFIKPTDHLVHYLEYMPDSMIFRHKTEKHIQLTISLDLFEMLYFIQKGYSPSLNDLKGSFMELIIFKNLLENLQFDELVVSKDNRKFFKISKKQKLKLVIEPMMAQL